MALRAEEMDEAASHLDEAPWVSHAAVALHAWYTGLESALERVARALDAEVPEGERWHRDLLSQLTVEASQSASDRWRPLTGGAPRGTPRNH